MRLKKDQARILAAALGDFKYDVAQSMRSANAAKTVVEKLQELQDELEKYGNDKRRKGRRSANDWRDLIHRFCSTSNS